MKRIVLIACVSRKGNAKAKAKDLYKGPLFTYSMAYAQSLHPDKIFILSALHHVLDLDKEIEPYDVTLSNVRPEQREKKPALKVLAKAEAQAWGQTVLQQLSEVADLQNDKFIILAGQSYINPIREGLANIAEPLLGLKQGERVQFLAKEITKTKKTVAFRLHQLFNGFKTYEFPFERNEHEIPENGIYVMFEKGEVYDGMKRIVRVGTHDSNYRLRVRLKEHFITENKNRSILRKNIGRCILNKDKSSYRSLWELNTTTKADKAKNSHLLNLAIEKQIEQQVSEYLRNNFSFFAFQVDTKKERLLWRKKIASTLAQSNEMTPSSNWLGLFSTEEKIKTTGLWQVNNLSSKILTEEEFETLETMITEQAHHLSNT